MGARAIESPANSGPFQKLPTHVMASMAAYLDSNELFLVLPRVSRAFANESVGKKLYGEAPASWGNKYVHYEQWWAKGGRVRVHQAQGYQRRALEGVAHPVLIQLARLSEQELRRQALEVPTPHSTVELLLKSAFNATAWSFVSGDTSTLTQIQFRQLVDRLQPGHCGKMRSLSLAIPRPDRGSRSRNIAPAANIIDLTDVRRLGDACPNVESLELWRLTKAEVHALLTPKRAASGDEAQFPEKLRTLKFIQHGLDPFDESLIPLLARIGPLQSIRVWCDERLVTPDECARLSQAFSQVQKLDDLRVYWGDQPSTACVASIVKMPSITSLSIIGCRFQTWHDWGQVMSLPSLRGLTLGNNGDDGGWPERGSCSDAMRILVKSADKLDELVFRHWYAPFDTISPHCADMPRLRKLVISESIGRFTNLSLEALGRCSGLTELGLRWSDRPQEGVLTDEGLLALRNCRALTRLTLSVPEFTTEGVAKLVEQLPALQNLDIRLAPHLAAAPLTAAGRGKVNVAGSTYESLSQVHVSFQQNHPDKMKLFGQLPEGDREAIYARAIYYFDRVNGSQEKVNQLGERQFCQLAFLQDTSLPEELRLDHRGQAVCIELHLSDCLKKIKF